MSTILVVFNPIRECTSALFHCRTGQRRFEDSFRERATGWIGSPAYLIRTQRDNLTLLTRKLHHHNYVISDTSNHHYCGGQDKPKTPLPSFFPKDFVGVLSTYPATCPTNTAEPTAIINFPLYYRRNALTSSLLKDKRG